MSGEIFDRFIKQLDYARNIFLATDIDDFQKYRLDFDSVLTRGKLDTAYDIYNLNMQRRLERYEYAVNLLSSKGDKNPFDFTKEEIIERFGLYYFQQL